jgi:beta-lactam-binding protein with PASTA domain
MSRYAVLAVLAACTINGKAVGPHLGGPATAPATTDVPAGEPAAPSQAELAVPNVVGMTHAQADEAIRKAGFPEAAADLDDMHRTPDAACDNGSARDRVCQQYPAAGQTELATIGVQIRLGVAPGAPVVVMPDLHGKRITDAVAALRTLGFPAPFVHDDESCDRGTVCDQSIPAGTNVDTSWTLTIEGHE